MTETENVATYARIRPYNPAINEDKRLTARAFQGTKILNQNGDREDTYNFTQVLDMTDSTNDLFVRGMKPLLDYKILQGITSIFIVYGQSGSGKSFTLIGEEGHLGVLPMSLQYLLKQDNVQRIDISSIECYGIKAAKIGFYDLVSQLKIKQKNPKKYDAYSTKDNSRLNPGNAQMIEITMDNCLKIITELQEVSHMAPTLKNPHSSRGHTCYFARVKMTGLEDVHFIAIDLAGSEGQTALGTKDEFVNGLQLAMNKGKLKLNKKQMNGIEQMYKTRSLEAGCINNGLTQLQTIFGELIRKKISKAQGLGLRKVLSSFISLNSAYAILFTLSASANNNKVTRATLNFAKQTQLVKVDTKKAAAKIDKDAIIKELSDLIEALNKELGDKNKIIEELKKDSDKNKKVTFNESENKVVEIEDDDDYDDQESFFNVRIDTIRQQISEAEEEEAKWTVNTSLSDQQSIDPIIGTMSEDEMKDVFNQFDEDKGGTIDCIELQNALKTMGHELTMEEVKIRISEVDANADGEVDFEEFKVMVGQTWFINAFHDKLIKSMEHHLHHMTILNDGDENDEDEDEEKEEDDDNNNNNNNNNNDELMEEIKQKMEIIEGLQIIIKEIKESKEENEKKQSEEIDGLQNEIKNLKISKEENDNKQMIEIERLETEINNLKNKQLLQENDKLKNEMNSLQTENEELSDKLKIQNYENENNKLQKNINILKNENEELRNDVNIIRNENYELKHNKYINKTDEEKNDNENGSNIQLLDTKEKQQYVEAKENIKEDDDDDIIMSQIKTHKTEITPPLKGCGCFISIFNKFRTNNDMNESSLYHHFE